MYQYFKENILQPTNELCDEAGLERIKEEIIDGQIDDNIEKKHSEDYPNGDMAEPYDIENER